VFELELDVALFDRDCRRASVMRRSAAMSRVA